MTSPHSYYIVIVFVVYRNRQSLNKLLANGLITKKASERLHSIRYIRNDSIHELKEPEEEQLLLVLEIIHHLLNDLYLIDVEIALLSKKICEAKRTG
jgi:hypothetical protein